MLDFQDPENTELWTHSGPRGLDKWVPLHQSTCIEDVHLYLWLDLRKGVFYANYKYLEYHFEIFNSLYLKNARSSLCAFLH